MWKFIFGAITGREDNEKIRVHCQLITKIIVAMENSGLYEKFDPSIPWKQTFIYIYMIFGKFETDCLVLKNKQQYAFTNFGKFIRFAFFPIKFVQDLANLLAQSHYFTQREIC